MIETYNNGYDWYRLWSDKFCEQGGTFTTDVNGWQNAVVILHKPYKDIYYHVSITSAWSGNGDGASYYIPKANKTTRSFNANVAHYAASYGNATWKASGYI